MLEKAAKLFELHIYTAGSRSYADAVARILDPKGVLFGRRILSRDESGCKQYGMATTIVISLIYISSTYQGCKAIIPL
jgi:hypothetical protein